MKRILLLLAVVALLLGGGQARADYIATVTVDTTLLTSNPGQGPFGVWFDFPGRLAPQPADNNNTATITNFNLSTGGSLTPGTSTSSRAVTGNLSSTLTLKDNPSAVFTQQFTPGSSTPSSLSFTLDLTTNVSPGEVGRPDTFDFYLETQFTPTSAASVSSVTISITGPNPTVVTAGGLLLTSPTTNFPAPVVTPEVSSAVPEPSTLTLLGIGSLGLFGYGWRRRRQAAA